MKKGLLLFFAVTLVFSIVLALPTQALSKDVYVEYALKQGNADRNGNSSPLGGLDYWQKQIDNKKWTGENRPAALMGDANIDGKVDAQDALFALHFSVQGNILTSTAASSVATTPHKTWRSRLQTNYTNGTLEELVAEKDVWLKYCWYNSPFFADVTKDCVINAKDALKILQYSVGKAKNFPENDFTTVYGRFVYYPWPTEYYPDIYDDMYIDITDKEFADKFGFVLGGLVTPTDITPTDK